MIKPLVKMGSAKNQQGATLLGMLIVAVFIVFVALIVMKITPAYIEFFSVKKVLKAMHDEPLSTMTTSEIKTSFNKRASTSYVDVVTGADLVIEKGTSSTVVTVNYEVVKPIIGNVSVLIDFSARSDGK
jgi:beta-lactamase superfamily II metal-dependent hydrolase